MCTIIIRASDLIVSEELAEPGETQIIEGLTAAEAEQLGGIIIEKEES